MPDPVTNGDLGANNIDPTPDPVQVSPEPTPDPVQTPEWKFEDLGLTLMNGEDAIKDRITDLKLSKDQAKMYLDSVRNDANTLVAQYERELVQQREDTLSALKTPEVWGGDWEKNLAETQNFVRNVFGKDFADYLFETNLGNDLRMILPMYRLKQKISDDSFKQGSPTNLNPEKKTTANVLFGGSLNKT